MKKQEQQTIVINVNLTQGLAVVLSGIVLTVALLGYLTWGQEEVVASGPQAPLAASTGLRQYYLTPGYVHDGSTADTACDSGYHMASLWEILDTSNLKYNTDKGAALDDSGDGPPVAPPGGWVRTGYTSNASSTGLTGQVNCNAWTSESPSDWGTYVRLSDDWENAFMQNVHVWNATQGVCANSLHVWCIADDVSSAVYLPIILKSY